MPRLTSFSQGGLNGRVGESSGLDLESATVYTNANIYSRDSSTSWSSIAYNSTGTGFVATQDTGDSDARIYQYSMSVPYDFTAAGQSISYVGEQALGSSAFDNSNNFTSHQYTGFNFSNTGDYWSILARTTDELLIRSSTSGYFITGSAVDRGNLTLSSITGSVDDVFFNAANTRMYIVINSAFAPSNHLRIREYTITSFDNSAAGTTVNGQDAEYTEWYSTTGSRISSVTCCRWNPTGNWLCVRAGITSMHLFYTSTPYDMANMSKTAVSSVDPPIIGWNSGGCFAWWADSSGMSGFGTNGRPYSLVF